MSALERLREEAEAEMRRKAPRYALESPPILSRVSSDASNPGRSASGRHRL